MGDGKKEYDCFLEYYKQDKLRNVEVRASNFAVVISILLRDAVHFKDIDDIHAFEIECPKGELDNF